MESTAVTNLSPTCRARDLGIGVFALAGTLLVATVLAKTGVHWAWRLLLILPFALSARGFLQGRYGT